MKMVLAGVVFALLAGAAPAVGVPPPDEVTERTFLYEVVRHLYRWHLDERDVEPVSGVSQMEFRVRALTPALDEGDRSKFAEVVIPALRCQVLVKRPDYVIEETGVAVKSRGFRIYRVSRDDAPAEAPEGSMVIPADLTDLRFYLFRTRSQREFPDPALVQRLRNALRNSPQAAHQAPAQGVQTVFFSPLSPVSNEWWVYWENRKLLIRYSSDIDLTNPEVWDHEQIGIDTWDAYEQVVVSTDEAPGSNEFITRDQMGRALYNCLVLGRREELAPASTPAAAAPVAAP